MTLQVAVFGVVRITILDHFQRDLLRDAPAEEVLEIADDGLVIRLTEGNGGVDIDRSAVQAARIAAPAQLGIHAGTLAFLIVGGLGQVTCVVSGHRDTGQIRILRDLRRSFFDGFIGTVGDGGIIFDDVGLSDRGIEGVRSVGLRGYGRGPRIHAVHGHDVQAACNLLGIAIVELAQDIQLQLFSAIHELVRDAGAIFDLDRYDRLRGQRHAATGLRCVLCHHVDFVVHGEGEILVAIEGNRFLVR